jgi:hypothetical protein
MARGKQLDPFGLWQGLAELRGVILPTENSQTQPLLLLDGLAGVEVFATLVLDDAGQRLVAVGRR